MRVLIVALVVLAGCADSATAPEDDFGLEERLQATATTGIIRGVVVDETITPVADATVTLVNQDKQTTSDVNGLFGFDGLQPGSYFLEIDRIGYGQMKASATVEAGIEKPPIVRIMLEEDPSELPFIEELSFHGHLTCGAAVFYTSVGCTTLAVIAGAVGDTSIWSVDFERVPDHAQGELVWRNTQALSGNFIWQIVQSEYPGSPQPHIGHMETTPSPALAYIDKEVTTEYADWILSKGIDYRFFGGPHELCPQHVGDPSVNRFGCGVTIDQSADAYIHQFYNMNPLAGWRFTSDGPHPL